MSFTVEVGLMRGVLYHHFGDRRGLFQAVVATVDEDMAHRLERRVKAQPDRWHAFVEEGVGYIEMALEPDISWIMLRDGPAVLGTPASWPNSSGCVDALRASLVALIADDIARSVDVEATARLLSGASSAAANWNMLSAKIDRASSPEGTLPEGWFKSGKSPHLYDTRIDHENGSTALIAAKPEVVHDVSGDDFCTVMQSVDAEPFKGKRIRLAGELRTEGAATGTTILFRVDGAKGTLMFDNLELRRPDGQLVRTQGWSARSVVFDIPEEALSLHYGFFLKGAGKCSSRKFSLNEVDDRFPTSSGKGPVLPRPTNLDFG